jgi:hypothetical protein
LLCPVVLKISVTSLRPRSLLHWTGLPVKAFLVLVARVAALLPEPGRGRPWALLLAAIAWRTNLTNRQLADLFGVGVATVHRVIDRITPLIAGLLNPPDDHRSKVWVVDGTLIPLHDQTKTAKSKNHRRPVNVKAFAKRRARAEHGIARLKDFQILRQHRRRGDTINQTSRAVAALHNMKIDCA